MRDGSFFLSRQPSQVGGAPRYNSECPQCGRYYLSFVSPGFKGDQSVCQACADKNFASTRDKMQRIEAAYAKAELQQRLSGEEYKELQEESPIIGPFLALSGTTS